MADIKLTIVGTMGSGKTTYLAGMYYIMSSGLKGFTLSTDHDSDLNLERMWETMMDASIGVSRFPPLSDQVKEYEFKLKYGYKEIMSFDWIDYPGGALKHSSNSEMYTKFMENLKESACLLLCIDGNAFSSEVDDPSMYLKMQGARNYGQIINEFVDQNDCLPPVSIIITKYDLCTSNSTEIVDYIKDAFSPLFIEDGGKNFDKLVSIIPITMGKNIASQSFRGELAPVNIHLPIAFAIWCTIASYISKLKLIISETQGTIDTRKKGIFNRIFGSGTTNEMVQFLETNNKILAKLEEDSNRLLGELNKKKIPTFLNGTPIDISTFAF